MSTEIDAEVTGRSYLNPFLEQAAENPGDRIRVEGTDTIGPPWSKDKSSAASTCSYIRAGDIPGPYRGQEGRFNAQVVPYNNHTNTLDVWQDPNWFLPEEDLWESPALDDNLREELQGIYTTLREVSNRIGDLLK